uniref:Oligopeptide transporter n=1 Tax=Saccharum hybrid cultivar R570 TaxID=131158 RepID=A0A059Q315_9POAL|nr:hypothetical protein SHCRBa_009_B01_R_210 [Saccharum hybrid cultivar R570]
MKRYEDAPGWWFHTLLVLSISISLVLCTVLRKVMQLPWWGLLFACAVPFVFTLPISIITATTNQAPGLNVVSKYIIGLILPSKPIANVVFKAYGYVSSSQAVSFLAYFKLGHYMKILPRSMFLVHVQLVGTVVAATVNLGVAYWLLDSVPNICQDTASSACAASSRHWATTARSTGSSSLAPRGPPSCTCSTRHSRQSAGFNLSVLIGATAGMPPATAVNYNSWLLIGVAFNFFVFQYRKRWWQWYNYILSAALDAGMAFMGVLLYFTLSIENRNISWWGADGEHCPLASCPTARGWIWALTVGCRSNKDCSTKKLGTCYISDA